MIMKKLLFLLAIALPLVFTSCSKDDDESFSLKGKTYATANYSATIFGETYTAYKVWRFISDTEVEQSTRKNSPTGTFIGDVEKGTYTLNYPKLNVQILDGVSNNKYECDFLDENTFRSYWYSFGGNKEPHDFAKQ
jgi:hypothetical protein